jgi:hypothetical protein
MDPRIVALTVGTLRFAHPTISEARDGRHSIVIASEAKQSSGPQSKYGLLRRYAPRNDGG